MQSGSKAKQQNSRMAELQTVLIWGRGCPSNLSGFQERQTPPAPTINGSGHPIVTTDPNGPGKAHTKRKGGEIEMYIDYIGYVEDELILDEIEKVLERFGIKDNIKEISRKILDGLEDFFSDSCD